MLKAATCKLCNAFGYSYVRIKSCPPEYMLPRRYYANMIERNRTFSKHKNTFLVVTVIGATLSIDREAKTITGIMPL